MSGCGICGSDDHDAFEAKCPMTEGEQFLALVESLLDTYRPEGVLIWLGSANRHLDGRTPRALLQLGEWDALLAEADRLAGGSPAADATTHRTGRQER